LTFSKGSNLFTKEVKEEIKKNEGKKGGDMKEN